jgi:hypothetical protein
VYIRKLREVRDITLQHTVCIFILKIQRHELTLTAPTYVLKMEGQTGRFENRGCKKSPGLEWRGERVKKNRWCPGCS